MTGDITSLSAKERNTPLEIEMQSAANPVNVAIGTSDHRVDMRADVIDHEVSL